MRVVGVLLTVLISAGLLGSSVADNELNNLREGFASAFKTECDNYGGPKAYDNLVEKFEEFSTCVYSLVNESQLQSDIAKAKASGTVDIFFKEYCSKVPAFEICLKNIIDPTKACLEETEAQEGVDIVYNATTLFLDFICDNEGELLSKFVAADGPECLSSKLEALGTCAEEAFDDYGEDSTNRSIAIDDKACSDMKKFKDCTIKVLETCDNPTTASIIKSMFEYFAKATPCEGFHNDHEMTSSRLDGVTKDIPSPKEKVVEYFVGKCEKNGGPTAWSTVNAEFTRMNVCARSVIGEYDYVRENVTSESNVALDYLTRHCHNTSEIDKCEKQFTDTVKICLDTEEKETADIFHKIGKSMRESICRDEGKLREIFATGSPGCASSTPEIVLSCAMKTFGDYFIPSESRLIQRLEKPLIINSQDCVNTVNFQKCVVKELKECGNSEMVSDLFESVANSVFKETPCEYLLKMHTSADKEISKPYGSFEDKCVRNGGPTAFVVAVEAMEFAAFNFFQFMFMPHLRGIDKDIGRRITAKIYCSRSKIVTELEKYATSSIKPCLETREHKFLEIVDNVVVSSVEFFCDNEGERLAAIADSDPSKCWTSKAKDIVQCGREAFGFNETVHLLDLLTQTLRYDKPLILTAENCVYLDNFKDCGVKKLKECGEEGPSNFLISYIDSVKKSTPCKYLIDAESGLTAEERQLSNELEFFFGSILEDFGMTSRFTYEQADAFVKENCVKYGGVEAYGAAKPIYDEVLEGVKSLGQKSVHFIGQMKAARTDKKLDVFFKEYCHKVDTDFKNYMENVTDVVKSCLDPESRETVDAIHIIVNVSLDFVCQNDGGDLAKFVGTGGLECFADKQQAIQKCLSDFSNQVSFTDSKFPGVEDCAEMNKAETCIVKVLEECDDKTPANMVNYFIDSILKESPCADVLKKKEPDMAYIRFG